MFFPILYAHRGSWTFFYKLVILVSYIFYFFRFFFFQYIPFCFAQIFVFYKFIFVFFIFYFPFQHFYQKRFYFAFLTYIFSSSHFLFLIFVLFFDIRPWYLDTKTNIKERNSFKTCPFLLDFLTFFLVRSTWRCRGKFLNNS